MGTKAAVKTANEFGPMADELGALVKEMAPYAQKLSRIDDLKKALRAACTVGAAHEWTIQGAKFIAVLGPRANERHVSVSMLVKMIGAKAYALFATTTLKALEENTSPAIVAAVVTCDATGSRSLKTFERGGSA